MRGSRLVVLLVPLVVLACAASTATASRAAKAPVFKITRFGLPDHAENNGPAQNMTIYWQGKPRFPLTLVWRNLTCVRGTYCGDRKLKFSAHANPLVAKGFWHCANQKRGYTMDIYMWLVDAQGHRTGRVNPHVICRTTPDH